MGGLSLLKEQMPLLVGQGECNVTGLSWTHRFSYCEEAGMGEQVQVGARPDNGWKGSLDLLEAGAADPRVLKRQIYKYMGGFMRMEKTERTLGFPPITFTRCGPQARLTAKLRASGLWESTCSPDKHPAPPSACGAPEVLKAGATCVSTWPWVHNNENTRTVYLRVN